jgi:hypothetical protein
MGWKFWKKEAVDVPRGPKLPGPKDLPDAVGRHLVVEMDLDPDWVWTLKAVVRPREGQRYLRDIRVFDPAKALGAGVGVRNYDTLDGHPEQILFAGWYDNDTGQIELAAGSSDRAA